MKYTGWFETENGVLHFEQTATCITDLYVALSIRDKHHDFGHTDMEIYDDQGMDVTASTYQLIQMIESSDETVDLLKGLTNDDA